MRQPRSVRRFGYRGKRLDSFLEGRCSAHHVQAVRDQRVFQFQDLLREFADPDCGVGSPVRRVGGQFNDGGLCLDQPGESVAVEIIFRREAAPPFEGVLEVRETSIQPACVTGGVR